MQILFLITIACIVSLGVVFCTQQLLTEKRGPLKNLTLAAVCLVVCLLFSVLAEFVITAKRPVLYYHRHALGPAAVKIFTAACAAGGFYYALLLVIAERKKAVRGVLHRLGFRWSDTSSEYITQMIRQSAAFGFFE